MKQLTVDNLKLVKYNVYSSIIAQTDDQTRVKIVEQVRVIIRLELYIKVWRVVTNRVFNQIYANVNR
jgi:hypothetical protein